MICRLKQLIQKIKYNFYHVTIVSFLWLLYRTGKKPSRTTYPCQKAAVINVGTFIYLSPLVYVYKIKQFFKYSFNLKLIIRFCSIVFLTFTLSSGINIICSKYQLNKVIKKLDAHQNNAPLGISVVPRDPSGFINIPRFETRVVSIHDSSATNWDYEKGYYWEYIDKDVVNNMMAIGVRTLTGKTNTQDAWQALIHYQPGEIIAIKLNFANSGSCDDGDDNDIDALSETANAVIDGLTSIDVQPDNIWFYDAMNRAIPNRFIDRINNLGVRFYGSEQGGVCNGNYYQTSFEDPKSPEVSRFTCSQGNLPHDVIRPAKVLVDADHLINIPIFKSHGNYITLALKNHYGSVTYDRNDRTSMHFYFNQGNNKYGCDLETENILADINNNSHIRDKTRLIIGDGLFGNAHSNWESVERWQIFGNDDPNILFFSADPVAISSVMTDYIMYERGWQDHEQLHAGEFLGLGIHEHWNNEIEKKYISIEYIAKDLQ